MPSLLLIPSSFLIISSLLAKSPNEGPSFLSVNDPLLPEDYNFQGEYIGAKFGAQVISLSNGRFQVVVLPGGLPGAGWDQKNKSLLDGKLNSKIVKLDSPSGPKKYLADDANLFSATQKFPPVGQKNIVGKIFPDGKMRLQQEGTPPIQLNKIIRKSSTLGKKPPANAIYLFDGSNADAFSGGRLDATTKTLHTDGQDIRTKRKFLNYHMHLEFMLPYRPSIRGQHRGNSGFYQVDLYEMQILDSFGLEGLHFDCGGIYSQVPPRINACLPPLVWQTYDVDFSSAQLKGAQKVKMATLSARLNGIVIHENYQFPGKTGGSRNEQEGTAGPIKLQGHANPLQFRNIWIIEK